MTDTGTETSRNPAVDFAFHAITVADAARLNRLTMTAQIELARRVLDHRTEGALLDAVAAFFDLYRSDRAAAGDRLGNAMRAWLDGRDLSTRRPLDAEAGPGIAFASTRRPAPRPAKAPVHDWQSRADTGLD